MVYYYFVAALSMCLPILINIAIYYVKYNLKAILYPILFMAIIFSPLQSALARIFIGFIYWVGWYFLAISKDERTIIKGFLN